MRPTNYNVMLSLIGWAHTQNDPWIYNTSFNVLAKYFVWNFKGFLRNCTLNILPIHWKIWFLYSVGSLRAFRFKSSYMYLECPGLCFLLLCYNICHVLLFWYQILNSTPVVLKLEYSRMIMSILWLLMSWLQASPGHQHPCYYLCWINRPLSSTRKDFNYLCYFCVKINIENVKNLIMLPEINLAQGWM